MMKKTHFIIAFLLCGFMMSPALAQKRTDRSYIRSGNRAYSDSLWHKAEIKYRKAIDMNAASADAQYNLANTLYNHLITDSIPNEQFSQVCQEIIDYYNASGQAETDKMLKSQINHNIGNTYYLRGLYEIETQQQNIKETYASCIAAYKEALRNNPADDETRFNLAKAKAIYNAVPPAQSDEQQQQQQQDANQDNQQEEQPQQREQDRKEDMSKENAEQILQALMQDEKDLQEKVQKVDDPSKRKLEKDW